MPTAPVEQNIEVKARIPGDSVEFARRIKIAQELTDTQGELLKQLDVFFNAPQGGRLKLRYLEPPARAQLIYYERPDVPTPKLSKYYKVDVDNPEQLENILTQSNGARGMLRKQRLLFIYDMARIHIDQVQELGNFIEFEVCLERTQPIELGQAIADELIGRFGVQPEDMLSGAYFDMLNN